jgi:hypothetical protein
VLLLDRNPAGHEGPWETFARMAVLRTPKTLVGSELGVPSLLPYLGKSYEFLEKTPAAAPWLRHMGGRQIGPTGAWFSRITPDSNFSQVSLRNCGLGRDWSGGGPLALARAGS